MQSIPHSNDTREKFANDWPAGLRDIHVRKCGMQRLTDAQTDADSSPIL